MNNPQFKVEENSSNAAFYLWKLIGVRIYFCLLIHNRIPSLSVFLFFIPFVNKKLSNLNSFYLFKTELWKLADMCTVYTYNKRKQLIGLTTSLLSKPFHSYDWSVFVSYLVIGVLWTATSEDWLRNYFKETLLKGHLYLMIVDHSVLFHKSWYCQFLIRPTIVFCVVYFLKRFGWFGW